MEADELETEGEELRGLAALDDDPVDGAFFSSRLPWVLDIARGVAEPGMPRAWRVENDDGLDTIYVHKGLREYGRNWLIASEGVEGHVVRREPAIIDPNLKATVWQLNSVVLMPRYAVRRDVSYWGIEKLPLLAERWRVTQTIFARRFAELRNVPYAYVSGRSTIRAGLDYGIAKLATLIHRDGDRYHQVIKLTDRAGTWVVWPKDW